ncbi:DNA polymerase III subunit delta' C-terminal domain-containing protein, partial [Kaarinaea lacus]
DLASSGPQNEMARLLALAVGAPLLARQYAQQDTLKSYQQLLSSFEKLAKNQADPVAEAKSWEAVGLAKSVKWIYLWVATMIRLKSGIERVDTKSEWLEPGLENLAQRINSERLFQYLDKVTETSRFVNSQVNVQLTLEDLLISWREINA